MKICRLVSVVTACICAFGFNSVAQQAAEQRIEVAMRMIGHQVLLSVGDSTSRVLPINKEGNRYKISFNVEFPFEPEALAATIRRVAEETALADHFIVEVENCTTELVVYSYEIDNSAKQEVIPCKSRDLPKACYDLYITLLDSSYLAIDHLDTASNSNGIFAELNRKTSLIILISILIMLITVAWIFRQRRSKSRQNLHVVSIGNFRFDKTRMELALGDKKIELTSKECALLQLLYDSANDTVERDTILKMVWDDEGDYVGRTLDVFISKLRKKLEADSKVKIANIRGIGYKLIVSS